MCITKLNKSPSILPIFFQGHQQTQCLEELQKQAGLENFIVHPHKMRNDTDANSDNAKIEMQFFSNIKSAD